MLRIASLAIALAVAGSAPAYAAIEKIDIPPSRQQGLDMILVDEDAMPQEPELARRRAEMQTERWDGGAVDLLVPSHHLYSDLARQLARYQDSWGKLPQVRIGAGGLMGPGSTDARVPALRERLGLPRSGGYDQALQAKLAEYQRAHGLQADGKAGAATIASLDRGAAYYQGLILLNMERARRLPASDKPGKYILVDAGSAQLWMYEDGRPVGSMKVVVGAPATETPMLAAPMRFSSVNPYWNVPPELVRTLIAPRVLAGGMTYLSDRGYQVLDSWDDDAALLDPSGIDWAAVARGEADVRVRQLPGGANSMGEIKFMLPNEYGIYLHDTPSKALFAEEDRWVSNGCVRVEDARRLARWLHGEMPHATSTDREERVDLDQPVPVYITYFTVGADAKGLSFRKDRYERDKALLARFGGDGQQMIDRDEQFRRAMKLES